MSAVKLAGCQGHPTALMQRETRGNRRGLVGGNMSGANFLLVGRHAQSYKWIQKHVFDKITHFNTFGKASLYLRQSEILHIQRS
jgi:hypothetical protein